MCKRNFPRFKKKKSIKIYKIDVILGCVRETPHTHNKKIQKKISMGCVRERETHQMCKRNSPDKNEAAGDV